MLSTKPSFCPLIEASIDRAAHSPSFITPASLLKAAHQGVQHIRTFTQWIPPGGYVLLSCFAVQLGLALMKSLYSSLGAAGTVFLCKLLGAVLLLLLYRPRWKLYSLESYVLVGTYGLTMAVGSYAFYAAIERIPLGVATTLEFLGPLGVALLGSHRRIDLLWISLAVAGVVLLNPLAPTSINSVNSVNSVSIDMVGIGLALVSAFAWGSYIMLAGLVGRVFPGGSGLALGVGISSLLLLPGGIAAGGMALLNPSVLLLGVLVAFLNTVLPYSLEFAMLKQVPPRVFGILISIEPAIAAIVGFLILGEHLSSKTLVAIVMVIAAAIGVTWFSRQNPRA